MENQNTITDQWEGAFAALKTYLPTAIKAEILSSKPPAPVLDFIQNGFYSGRCTPEQIRAWAMKNCSAWSDIVNKGKHPTDEATAAAVASNLDAERISLAKYLIQPKLE